MAPPEMSNGSASAVTDFNVRAFDNYDPALPIETDSPQSADAPLTTSASTTAQTVDVSAQDRTVAIALVVIILVVLVLFTLAYVLYQRRRRICGGGGRGREPSSDKDKPDLSANEVLITPVKANGAAESAPGGLVSGPRDSRTRQAVPRKWYDSAAIKYMDQSTDTLDRV